MFCCKLESSTQTGLSCNNADGRDGHLVWLWLFPLTPGFGWFHQWVEWIWKTKSNEQGVSQQPYLPLMFMAMLKFIWKHTRPVNSNSKMKQCYIPSSKLGSHWQHHRFCEQHGHREQHECENVILNFTPKWYDQLALVRVWKDKLEWFDWYANNSLNRPTSSLCWWEVLANMISF